MWLTKFFTAVMVALTGLLPSSCSKAKAPVAQKHVAVTNNIAAVGSLTNTVASIDSSSSTNKDLGALQLTNHFETCVNLGPGKNCTIRPTLVGRINVQITMSLESKNTAGKTKNLSVVQIVTKEGKPFEVAVGDMNLTLTPMLVQ